MLLLENLFFFADTFCETVSRMAKWPEEIVFEEGMPGYFFENPQHIGDLMGAIHGTRLAGFIGSLYRRFPFPENSGEFKQKAHGRFQRHEVESEIKRWAMPASILFHAEPREGSIFIGEFQFEKQVFRELVDYVWRGGYPRWDAEVRPDYVLAMKEALN